MIYREVEHISFRTKLCYWAIYVLFLALVLLASSFCSWAFVSSYYFCDIKGLSMQPTINPDITYQGQTQDAVLVKVTKNVKPGEIITISAPTEKEPDRSIIKRVIALDGDAVTIVLDETDNHYHTYVWHHLSDEVEQLKEDYIAPEDLDQWVRETGHNGRTPKTDTTSHGTTFKYEGLIYKNYLLKYADQQNKVIVKQIDGKDALFYRCDKDEIFFMGDHRSISSDARDVEAGITTVTHESVMGKVVYLIKDATANGEEEAPWWLKFRALFAYFWQEIGNFFAW